VDGQWQGTVYPLYYGALMFTQAAPAGSRRLVTNAGGQTAVRAWATVAPDRRIRVLVINDSLTSSALALVRTPVMSGPASVERLRAGSAYATGGITLGGQSFGATTETGLLPAPVPQNAVPRRGTYAVTLPAGSAALLTLPPTG
jgi:Glycosyl hydrolase family 79 C-terminal beta domain